MIHITDTNVYQEKDSIVTLGNFDGVHIGHKKLMDVLTLPEYRSLTKIVFSFYPHPAAVIKNMELNTILSREEKYSLIQKMGVDVFIEYPFNKEFSATSPEIFIRDILAAQLKCKVLVIGEGYRFGKDQSGNGLYLKEVGKRYGIKTVIMPHFMAFNDKISSSIIRKLILEGNMEKVSQLLGRCYSIEGEVINGRKIGRTLGFPTFNIIPKAEKILPPNGVYTSFSYFKEYGRMKSVTNIGVRPTVGENEKIVETYILDFQGDLYGKKVRVEICSFLRPEQKFENIVNLKKQIEFDKKSTVNYFKNLQ